MSEGNLFVALDVSLEKTALCVMVTDGSIRRESVVPTDAEAIADALAEYRGGIVQLGLESGPMSEWLVRGLEASTWLHDDVEHLALVVHGAPKVMDPAADPDEHLCECRSNSPQLCRMKLPRF